LQKKLRSGAQPGFFAPRLCPFPDERHQGLIDLMRLARQGADKRGSGGRAALLALNYYAHPDLFMTPTASLADIVLPVASCLGLKALLRLACVLVPCLTLISDQEPSGRYTCRRRSPRAHARA
jgi:hypothetical protein